MVHGAKFEVSKRYTVLEPVGQGAYGVVCAAKDEETQDQTAIKKIENAFEHVTFTKRSLRELRILRHLRHENLIDVRDIFLPGLKENFEDIYVVSELMESDLASILKSSQPLLDDHCQFFLYQILRGMKYVHSAQVIHRDLKPRNLLVNGNCDLKICDFGLARVNFTDMEFQTCPMTEYVCTRWYRAPEVLCSWTDYTGAIDIWSIGCIFAEMLVRKPLFPGHNTQHQLQLIINFLGTPHGEELRKIPNDKCRKFIESLPAAQGRKFEEAFPNASGSAIEFLHKTLRFDPDKRVTVEQALQLPYLSQLFCPEDEPTRPPLDTSDFEFERRKITSEALREELFLEAMQYYPDKLQRYLEEQMQGPTRYNIGNYRLLTPGESQYSSDEEGDA
jgi:serine/threonine protein kinase